ncbi:hypothetical protein [Vibrio diazotrophicus]|jgi:hypothetical protein|uniref:AlpA family transcriptional regulator n=1 Tax=Vibrio diazotrophicus TaxID=685 RepID=A0A329EEX7_VIBDI|nr:hypothetical protein [Vibrio diazotrophicus]PNH94047.1 hypothetical protein C1M59_04800 [Vibrio diazotrophicus]RAS62673.1 hypothetical protein DET48_11468 [Vibrio diazotrophicus]
MPRAAVITLKKHASDIGYSPKTITNRIHEGYYPPGIFYKDKGQWLVDTEEWDRWHRSNNKH